MNHNFRARFLKKMLDFGVQFEGNCVVSLTPPEIVQVSCLIFIWFIFFNELHFHKNCIQIYKCFETKRK